MLAEIHPRRSVFLPQADRSTPIGKAGDSPRFHGALTTRFTNAPGFRI